MATITVQLDSAVQAGLAELAEARQQPISDVAADIIAMHVDRENWERLHILQQYDSSAPQAIEQMATKVVRTGNRPTVEASGRAAAVPYREITIEELLEGVEEGTSLGEYDWGPPRGAEFW